MYVALLGTLQAASDREQEVRANWADLPALVEGRDIDTVLRNGVHIRGRVAKVHDQALEVRVKHTSDPGSIPTGRAQVPREQLAVLSVRWKSGPARYLLAPALAVGVPLLLGVAHIGADEVGLAGGYTIVAASGLGGYLIGAKIDTKRVRVVIVNGPPQR